MDFEVRPAMTTDLESIAPWTQDTFEWGDYISDRFPGWLTDAASQVLVCVDAGGVPRAVAHVVMASPTEAWLEGARVHPDHKRSGMGTALNQACVEWARSRGARVARLAIESDNEAALRQVAKLDYRLGSRWAAGFIEPDPAFRAVRGTRLHPSVSADIDGAWMFWSTSALAAAGHEMLCVGWQWRTARPDDLRQANASGRLYQSPHGWAMFRETPYAETMWLATTPEDFPGLLDGILDHLAGTGVDELTVKVPALDWAVESLRRAGFSVSEVLVYYKAV